MNDDQIIAAVEQKFGRPLYVDPVQKAIFPAFLTAMGLSAITTMGIGFIPWWGIILGTAAVGFGIYKHHLSTTQAMREEVAALIERRDWKPRT